MPILKNAKKALRVSKRREVVNRQVKSRAKTALDAVKANTAPETVNAAYSAIDGSVKKNMIHRNKAARLKSQIARLAKAAGVKFVAKTTAGVKPAKTSATAKKSATKKPAVKKSAAKKSAS